MIALCEEVNFFCEIIKLKSGEIFSNYGWFVSMKSVTLDGAFVIAEQISVKRGWNQNPCSLGWPGGYVNDSQ